MTSNNLSRRAALAALAAAGTLGSIPVASAVLDTGAPVQSQDDHGAGYADAMDTFAMAWLTRWTEKGGSVTMDPTDPEKAWIGHAMFCVSPEKEKEDAFFAAVREQEWFQRSTEQDQQRFINDRQSFNRTFFDGKMRELSDLLFAVPGGVEAVKRIVLAFPQAGLRPVFATAAEEA